MSVSFGAFVFDTNRRQLLRQGTEIHLTPKAFDLLALLIARAPAVVSKTEIHNHLWPGTFVSDATLVGLVKEVRRALRSNGAESLVRTAHRVGYAFAGTTGADRAPTVPLPTHWLMVGGRRIALRNGANVIGRDPEAEVWLDVPGVSRRHAQITVESGVATLEDLGSKNGTLLGDRPIHGRVVLRNADRVQIATELLVFHVSTSGISTATHPTSASQNR